MRMVKLPSTKISVSTICLGTADWGSRQGDDLGRLYGAFRQAGGNCFDSAHCYAFWVDKLGMPERLLGECVRKYDKREDVVVCTKGCHITGGEKYSRPDRYMTPELLRSDLRDSLERLGMEYIDLYYLHRDDPRVPVDEIVDALNEQCAAGRLRAIAASNWRASRIAQANAYAKAKGLNPFVASQILWNLGHLSGKMPPDICVMDETETNWYQQTKLPVFAFSSTANGYFAAGKSPWDSYANETSAARRERAIQLARKHGATPNQIALAYLMGHPFPAVPITGTLKLDHLHDTLGAANVQLPAEEIRWLREG